MNESVKETTSLVEFEKEEVEIEAEVIMYRPRQLNPYQDETPIKILERWYDSGSFTITIGNSSVNVVDGLTVLFSKPSFLKSMASFRYLRWKEIEYRIQFSANPFMYGVMSATCLPRGSAKSGQLLAETVIQSGAQYSHTDCVLMDIAEQSDVIIKAPWIFNTDWLDFAAFKAGGLIGDPQDWVSMTIQQSRDFDTNRTDSSVSSTFVLNTMTRLVEPEVSGYFVAQMNQRTLTSAMGVLASVHTAYHMLSGDGFNTETSRTNEKREASTVVENRPSMYGEMTVSATQYRLGLGGPQFGGTHHSILSIIQKPSLYLQAFLSNMVPTSAIGWVVPRDVANALVCQDTRLAWMSQFFRFWRGSITFTVAFFMSPLNSCRVLLAVDYAMSGVSPVLIGDSLVKDITLRGSTQITFTVPYLMEYEFADMTTPTNHFPFLRIKLLNSLSDCGDQAPVLIYKIYQAAGPDFQFFGPRNPCPRLASMTGKKKTTKFEAQMRVADLCKSDGISGSQPKLSVYHQESILEYEDLMKRWSWRDASTDPTSIRPFLYDLDNPRQGNYDWASQLFLFWAGDTKFKLGLYPDSAYQVVGSVMGTNIATTTDATMGIPDIDRVEDGLVIISTPLTNVLEYQVPYFSQARFVAVLGDNSPSAGTRDANVYQPVMFCDVPFTTPAIKSYFVAGGDNLGLYYEIPPIYYTNWPDYVAM